MRDELVEDPLLESRPREASRLLDEETVPSAP
jgi:hypothetical protein